MGADNSRKKAKNPVQALKEIFRELNPENQLVLLEQAKAARVVKKARGKRSEE